MHESGINRKLKGIKGRGETKKVGGEERAEGEKMNWRNKKLNRSSENASSRDMLVFPLGKMEYIIQMATASPTYLNESRLYQRSPTLHAFGHLEHSTLVLSSLTC